MNSIFYKSLSRKIISSLVTVMVTRQKRRTRCKVRDLISPHSFSINKFSISTESLKTKKDFFNTIMLHNYDFSKGLKLDIGTSRTTEKTKITCKSKFVINCLFCFTLVAQNVWLGFHTLKRINHTLWMMDVWILKWVPAFCTQK